MGLSLDDLERDARQQIGEMAYAYYSGGADDERLLTGNRAAWAHWQLHPRVLAGIADAMEQAANDPRVNVVRLGGAGRGFCSGDSGPGSGNFPRRTGFYRYARD